MTPASSASPPSGTRFPPASFRCYVRGFGLDPTHSIWIIILLGVGLSAGLGFALEELGRSRGPQVAPVGVFMLCMWLGPKILRVAENRHRVELGEHGLQVTWCGAGALRPKREIPYRGILQVRKAGRQIVLNLGHGDSVRLRPARLVLEDLLDGIQQRLDED